MADNVTIPATGSGDATPKVAADEATYSGDTAKVQIVRLVHVAGAEGSKTVSEIADAANGIDVDVTRLPALVAGTANIGDVDVLTLPALPAGTNNIGDVDVLTLPNVTLAVGTNTNEVVGDVAGDIPIVANPVTVGGRASAAAPTDVSADGDAVNAWRLRNGAEAVVVTAAGALIAGDAANGLDVDVTRLPAIPAGGNAIGSVTANAGTNLNTSALALDATLTNQQIADNAAFTDGTTKVAIAGYIFDEAAGTALTENDAGAARMNANRALVSTIEDSATRGRRAVVTAASTAPAAADSALVVGISPNNVGFKAASTAPVAADLAMVVGLSPNMSTLAGALAKAEDAPAVSGDVGVAILGVRADPPAVATTSAAGDYSQISTDAGGVLWSRPRALVTYGAAYRLADATAGQLSLTFTFAANTNKQLATIYHAATAVLRVSIRRILLHVSTGALGVFNFEVRALSATTAPATGNPAITPGKYYLGDSAAEATTLALPTTAGSVTAADSPVSVPFEWNSAAAAATANPSGLSEATIVLYEQGARDGVKPLTIRPGAAEGFAINGRCTTAVALRFTAFIEFTEE